MQTKTIEKIINDKMVEWIETIDDEDLKIDLKNNILVSGGSITSLLLREDVHDFDVYINSIDVLKRLVKYYVKDYHGIQILDGREKYKYSDKEFAGEKSKAAFDVAVRTLKDDQIKLFFSSKDGGKRVNEEIKEEELNYTPLFFSPNAISLSNKVQIVCRFHGSNKDIHKTFDFIHATNYFTFKDGLVTNKESLESIITKQLKYQGSQYPLTSIIRVKKFIKRGWNINAGEMLKMMFQLSLLDLTDPDILEEQLIGVDVAFFGTLIDVLRGVDKEKMTVEYFNSIVDKVFNKSNDNE